MHQSQGSPVCIDRLVKGQWEPELRATGVHPQTGPSKHRSHETKVRIAKPTRGQRAPKPSDAGPCERQVSVLRTSRHRSRGPKQEKTQQYNCKGRPSGHETSMPSKSRQRYWPKERKGWVSGKINPCIATDCHLGSSLGGKLEPHKLHDGHHCKQLWIEQHLCVATWHDAPWSKST